MRAGDAGPRAAPTPDRLANIPRRLWTAPSTSATAQTPSAPVPSAGGASIGASLQGHRDCCILPSNRAIGQPPTIHSIFSMELHLTMISYQLIGFYRRTCDHLIVRRARQSGRHNGMLQWKRQQPASRAGSACRSASASPFRQPRWLKLPRKGTLRTSLFPRLRSRPPGKSRTLGRPRLLAETGDTVSGYAAIRHGHYRATAAKSADHQPAISSKARTQSELQIQQRPQPHRQHSRLWRCVVQCDRRHSRRRSDLYRWRLPATPRQCGFRRPRSRWHRSPQGSAGHVRRHG